MRATIEDQVLYLRAADMPRYRKGGSVVRNSYFWALRSIAARSPFDKPWEFESEVWFALNRMLISFFESGYLGTRETQLEFLDGVEVPEFLRPSATWVATFEDDDFGDFDDGDQESVAEAVADEAEQSKAAPSDGAESADGAGLSESVDPAESADPAENEPLAETQTDFQTDSLPSDSQPRRRSWRSTRLG